MEKQKVGQDKPFQRGFTVPSVASEELLRRAAFVEGLAGLLLL